MRTNYKFKVTDPESQATVELIWAGESKPDAEAVERVFDQLKGQMLAHGADKPPEKDLTAQQAFEAERIRLGAKPY